MPTLVYRDTGVLANRMREQSPTSTVVESTTWALEATASLTQRELGKFPMVPPGGVVTVVSATLTLFNIDARATTRTLELRKLLSAWTTTHACWNNRASSTAWNVAGALTGTDVDATVLATGTCPTTANTAFDLTGAGFNAYCQDVLNGATDFGYILNLIDDLTLDETFERKLAGPGAVTAANRPTLTIVYTVGPPPTTPNWTISSPTVDSDAGTVTLTVTLDAPALPGGFSGEVDTHDITALAGVDYVAQVAEPFSIAEGDTTGDIVITLIA